MSDIEQMLRLFFMEAKLSDLVIIRTLPYKNKSPLTERTMIMNKKISAFVTSMAMLASSATGLTSAVTSHAEAVTRGADLSTSSFFPEIINQGQVGSCVACATAYYQFTNEARRALYRQNPYADIDFTYSPASVYPLINDGGDYGSWEYKAYHALKDRGALTMDEMPYDGRFDLRFYTVDENGKKTERSDPQGINYITEGSYEYNEIVSGSTVKDAYGNKIINENDYEVVDEVDGKKIYRRIGEYIDADQYKALSYYQRDYYLPVYENKNTNTSTGLYWHEAKTYRAIPRDEEALLNALNVKLDSYEGWSLCSPNHGAKAFITEEGDVDWNTEDQTEREDQFIENIKDALDQGKVVAASTSFNYLCCLDSTYKEISYKENPKEKVVIQNVTKYDKNGPIRAGHEFTIVGYDDSFECDIDGDGYTYSPGEQGAFKIANSWGTGWGNDGFIWVMYDAVRIESANNGCPDPANIYTKNSNGTWYNKIYQRNTAIEEAYIINVSPQNVKLVSEVDVMTNDYYGLNVENTCQYSQPITNYVMRSFYYNPIKFSGPIYTDITRLCGSEINGKDYTVKVYSNKYNSKTIVKGIRLKDDKGKVVSECSFINGDIYMKELTNYESLEYTLGVNFEKGDLDYDHDYDADDYKKIMEYFDILSEDISEYEKNGKISEKFSAFQLELLDSNNDVNINYEDRDYFSSKLYS